VMPDLVGPTGRSSSFPAIDFAAKTSFGEDNAIPKPKTLMADFKKFLLLFMIKPPFQENTICFV
jgi:hypothetical protein